MMNQGQFTDGSSPRWRLASNSLVAEVELLSTGLCLASLHDLNQGMRWEGVPQHPVSYLALRHARKSEFAWHLRSWNLEEQDSFTLGTIELELDGDDSGLTLTEQIWLAADVPVMRRWVEVSNEGTAPFEIDRLHLLDLALDHDLSASDLDLFFVDAFAGHRKDRWEPGDANFASHVRALGPGEAVCLPVGAYQAHCTWLALRRAHGDGIVVGLEYDGAAEIRVYDVPRTAGAIGWGSGGRVSRGVRLVAAPSDSLNVRVLPGEQWRSPVAFCGLFQGDWDEAAHVTHTLVEQHLAPPWPDERFPYVIFNSWGYAFDIDPARLWRCLDIAADIGVEVFVADYGWARDVGDWVASGDKIAPLNELSERVHTLGMKLGVWMGFANASPTAPILAKHPDWRAYPDDWGSFQTCALCLAEPVVRDWVAEEAIRLVSEYGIDYLVHDFELITPCRHPRHRHPPDPAGYHSAEGYAEVLRRVRAAHPHLIIENCQGGGRIMTYAMVTTHDTSITSDGPVLRSALARRQALYGASYPFPLRYCNNYMEEPPTEYSCHTSMIGGPWILMDKMAEWGPTEVMIAQRNIALYKQIRPLFRNGLVGHLNPPDGVAWDGIHVQQPDTGQGVVFLFQPRGMAAAETQVQLKGLEPRRSYRLCSTVSAQVWEAQGAILMEEGLTWAVPMPTGQSDVILVRPK